MKDFVSDRIGDRQIRTQELKALVEEAWEACVSPERLRREIERLPLKMEALVAVDGDHISGRIME